MGGSYQSLEQYAKLRSDACGDILSVEDIKNEFDMFCPMSIRQFNKKDMKKAVASCENYQNTYDYRREVMKFRLQKKLALKS